MDPSTGRAPRSRTRGLSRRAQKLLWGVLCGLMGLLVGWDAAGDSGLALALGGLLLGAALGAMAASQLTRALPVLGVAIGPMLALTLMNLPRFTASPAPALPPIARRGAATSTTSGAALPYAVIGLGAAAAAAAAAIVLYALSRWIRGDRRPLKPYYRSAAWICFWITLAMVLLSHFAPA